MRSSPPLPFSASLPRCNLGSDCTKSLSFAMDFECLSCILSSQVKDDLDGILYLHGGEHTEHFFTYIIEVAFPPLLTARSVLSSLRWRQHFEMGSQPNEGLNHVRNESWSEPGISREFSVKAPRLLAPGPLAAATVGPKSITAS